MITVKLTTLEVLTLRRALFEANRDQVALIQAYRDDPKVWTVRDSRRHLAKFPGLLKKISLTPHPRSS